MENYEAGIDQNQGVVGTMARHQGHGDSVEGSAEDTELVGSRMPRLDPNIVTDQGGDALSDEDVVEATDNMGERRYVNDDNVVDDGNVSIDASDRG